MINLAIAIAGALVTGLLLGVWLSFVEAIIPAIGVGVGAYIFLARATGKRLETIMGAAQKELMAGRVDKAVAMFQAAKKWGKWQFFVEKALNSQIGALHFIQEEYNKALPVLQDSDPRNWVSRVMLATIYYRKKDYTKMDAEFESAAQFSKKQGLLYSVWAWCHWKNDNNERAIQILSRGDKELESKDDKLKQNLLNAQNGKKLKMKGYGNDWYQFMLEKPEEQRAQVRYR